MPESKTRKAADEKKKIKDHDKIVTERRERRDREDRVALRSAKGPTSRRWVPPVFITVGLLGVLWLVVYYIAGYQIPPMAKLGNWNILIGMGLMAASFIIATLWK